jgi:hypothetical protein
VRCLVTSFGIKLGKLGTHEELLVVQRVNTKAVTRHRTPNSAHNQSVIRKLNSLRQSRRIARVFNVMSDVSEERPARLQLLDVFQCFIHPQMSRMLVESQTVKHQNV